MYIDFIAPLFILNLQPMSKKNKNRRISNKKKISKKNIINNSFIRQLHRNGLALFV